MLCLQTGMEKLMYNRVFTFGCSYTNWLWPTWADIIAYDLQIPFYNLGQSGIGNIAISSIILEADLAYTFTKNDLIIVNWSSWHRIDIVDKSSREWAGGGNVFNNSMFPPKFVKKYWNQNNDIVKNATSIILSNRSVSIDYQSHMIDYEGRSEYGETSYNFTYYQNLLNALPKKNVFNIKDNSHFNNTIEDHHPDVLNHLAHACRIYETLNLTMQQSTVEKYHLLQDTIINQINHSKINPNKDWDSLFKFFSEREL